jgi:hypothetical protein
MKLSCIHLSKRRSATICHLQLEQIITDESGTGHVSTRPTLRAGRRFPLRADQDRGGVELLEVPESELLWPLHPEAVLSLLWQSVARSLSASPVPVLDDPELLLLLPVLVPVLELLWVPVELASARRLIPELPSSFEPMSEHAPRAVKAKATAIAIEFRVFISHLVDHVI